VIFGVSDPNPLTRGQGPVVLRRAGVEVAGGVLRQEAERLIAPYLHWRRSGLPWVILKWAMSLDGKTATASGESRWITGSKSRAAAHGLRRRVDAVLVGTETALRDDPLLTPRPARGRKPLRVVLDRRGRLPLDLRLLRRLPPGDAGGPVLYVASKRTGSRRLAELRRRGLEVLIVGESERGLDLHEILAALAQRDVSQLLVEGGGRLAAGFVEGGWASEVAAFVAPRLLGGAGAPTPLAGLGFAELARSPWLREVEVRMLDRDLCISGRVAGRGRPMVPLFDTRGR
jgi:diaminohydroxyphosphoribosylaminopyrimidine deaminase/5-amino-6-(5-phosphoribosylamino)uracil reductase